MATMHEGGFKKLLDREAHACTDIQTEGEGILLGLDSEEDSKKIIHGMEPSYPSFQECQRILNEHRLPKTIRDHVQVVCRVACTLAENLNRRGHKINLGIVMAASLLHDIAREEKDHARKGAQLIFHMGFQEVASVISSHMKLKPEQQNQLNETTIVYLADKLVSGHLILSLREHLTERLKQFKDKSAQNSAKIRIKEAMAIQKNIEDDLGLKVESILNER